MQVKTSAVLYLLLGLCVGCNKPAGKQAASSPSPSDPLIGTARAAAPPATLDPGRGDEVGHVFEAFLSPHQEPNEEANTPKTTPKQFQSTAPSKSRAQREADGHRGHGLVRFSKDLSRAYVDVKIDGIDPKDVNMFHIHCGPPDMLGPILVDFAQVTNIQENLADGVFSVEVTNEHLAKTVEHGHGIVGAFTAGCLMPTAGIATGKPPKVSTVAGMAQVAMKGQLYFNLHTVGQTFFGDIRGQLHAAKPGN